MNNSPVTEENAVESTERYPNRFKPGQSGNPGGRPKKTKEEKDALEEIRKFVPKKVNPPEPLRFQGAAQPIFTFSH